MPDVGDRVVRRAELGTIVGIYPDKPGWFEGEWPESPPRGPRGMTIIKWPGRKKLTVEPVASLITVQT
jgi:hypothetical protein